MARFTRTLGTLITSGVPILEGLSITARTSGNAVLEEALMKVRKAIEEGRTIVDPLRESGVFPNMVTQMIGVGEATGAMDAMLQKIADFYEDEVDSATKDMLAMLEPVIIGLLGVMHRRHRHFALHAAVLDDRQTGGLAYKADSRRCDAASASVGLSQQFQHQTACLVDSDDRLTLDSGLGSRMQSIFDERLWLAWLVKVRIIILTLLLGIELAIARLTPNSFPLRLFIDVILLWYAVSIFYLLLLSFWEERRIQSVLQVITDLIMVTLVVYVTGGVDSSLNFFYPLVIIVACILLPRIWAYLTGALAFILYVAVLELTYFELIPSYSTHPSRAGSSPGHHFRQSVRLPGGGLSGGIAGGEAAAGRCKAEVHQRGAGRPAGAARKYHSVHQRRPDHHRARWLHHAGEPRRAEVVRALGKRISGTAGEPALS